MIDLLYSIKDQLFDAPVEVKGAFNQVVGYFDSSKKSSGLKSGVYNYHPKTNHELEGLVRKLIEVRGNTADLNDIDVSNIKDLRFIFAYDREFNGDISRWDVSNAVDMTSLFYHSKFNGDISKWNVSNVRYMNSMFLGSEFNGDISKWDVSNVYDMQKMFLGSKFNGDISKWDVSGVINASKNFPNAVMFYMQDMFYNCPLEKHPPKWYRK